MSAALGFQIIVPVYNEAEGLEQILQAALAAGYLDKIFFVDDASTDDSAQILRRWETSHAISALFLVENHKKEGAIRQVLEVLKEQQRLEPYTILVDADSFMTCPANEPSVLAAVQTAIDHLRDNQLAALAFRIDAVLGEASTLLERCIFADYSAMQFDQWLTSQQRQLWVVNGPGGLFRSDLLLETLRDMAPDFETGDLLITVKLMKAGHGVAYYPALQVKTYVPRTLAVYFRQRRRWERGTTKVLWWERGFYASLFKGPNLLALATLIHLSLNFIIFTTLWAVVTATNPLAVLGQWFAVTYAVWFVLNVSKGLWNQPLRNAPGLAWYSVYCLMNGVLWFAVTTWARLAGFFDAVGFLLYVRGSRPIGE